LAALSWFRFHQLWKSKYISIYQWNFLWRFC
jgi:hypothetical protein